MASLNILKHQNSWKYTTSVYCYLKKNFKRLDLCGWINIDQYFKSSVYYKTWSLKGQVKSAGYFGVVAKWVFINFQRTVEFV